jgi:exosortase/archaeosortase family protein
MNRREVLGILIRYFILLLVAFLNVKYNLLYEIFTDLTVLPVKMILELIYPYLQYIPAYDCPAQIAPALVLKGYYACIIDACVAGAAYLFLLLLNLSTPMHAVKRVKSIVFLIATFLILNIIRIVAFIMLVTVGYKYFDFVHELTWILGSTILIIAVWFLNVWLFKIKSIPGYTDMYVIWQDILGKKNRRKDGHN